MFDTAPAQVGYMNAQHQRVIAHALSRDHRLVLVVRYAICGHQYGSAADDIVARHCPGHEKAPAGLPAEAGNLDWLERRNAKLGRRYKFRQQAYRLCRNLSFKPLLRPLTFEDSIDIGGGGLDMADLTPNVVAATKFMILIGRPRR